MSKYINKDALVEEIKRNISLFQKEKKTEKWSAEASQMNVISLGARIAMLEEILSFINTLEVKDADLNTEFDNYTKNILACDVQFEPFTHLYNCAKHFYELGMQVSNKTQKGE